MIPAGEVSARAVRRTRTPVCITSNTLGAGGAEMQRVLLGNALAAAGWPVTLVVLQRTGPLAERVTPGVRIHLARFDRPLPVRDAVLVTGVTNTEMLLGLLTRLLRRRITWLVAVHNPTGPTAPRPSRLARGLLFAADRVVALTETHRNGLERYWGVRADRAISNGVPPMRARSSVDARPAVAGYLGRLSTEHKGLDRLLLAAAHPTSADVAWRIAGTGPDEVRLRTEAGASDAAGRVTFLGHRTSEEFLASIRVLVLLSRYEGQPMVLLEAAAAGLPVVVSAELGLADDPVHGIRVVEADDPAAVVAAVRATLEGPPPLPVAPPAIEQTAALWAEELARPAARGMAAVGSRVRRSARWRA